MVQSEAKVAIELFHGRTSPDEDLDDWGELGPVFLVDYVHVTYWSDLKLGVEEPNGEGDLFCVEDLVYYDRVFYGDWSVFPAALLETSEALASRVEHFDPEKAKRPAPSPASGT